MWCHPLKYLFVYPFLPLTIAKFLNLFLHVESVVIWQLTSLHLNHSFISFLIPFCDLVSIAFLLISLWFTVQKFYWKKVECCFSLCGFFFNFISLAVIFESNFQHGIIYNILFNHLLSIFSWIFLLWWAWIKTKNTVSNLFISEWGFATENIEIEALQDHF
ncbi:unnamed protein product, partial [Mesorhabditis belari]|uniref:Uncharacterized protein n=1 Tax=Mesorhabditis belari TaxID=2138241 RepID=A0AAF3FRM0_9BILA